MSHDRNLDMSIVRQLSDINRSTGEFVAGILSNTIPDEQIRFATLLTDLAMTIKERITGDADRGSVIEGQIQDSHNASDRNLTDDSGA